jgi:hypothetical protein
MKPGRTFGLSLAIIASVLLFSILPLMQVSMVLLVEYRLSQQPPTLPLGNGENIQPIAVGGDFTGVADSTLILQTLLGLAFLLVALLAWIGRPPSIRFVLIAAVCTLTLLTLLTSILPLFSAPNLQDGIDSGAGVVRSLLASRALLTLLVPLYVLWYMNRAPARAFYRGCYLAEPDGQRKTLSDAV